MVIRIALVLSVAAGTAACAPTRAEQLRARLDRATLSLSDAVDVAELDEDGSIGIRAELLGVDAPVFAVGAFGGEERKLDVRVDGITGAVLSRDALPDLSGPCPSQPIAEAISTAEATVDGEATRVVPDDDGQCNRELQVLGRDLTAWSLKLAPDGTVLVEEGDDDAD